MTLERPHYLCFQLKKMVCVAFLNQDTPHRRPPSAENTDSLVFPVSWQKLSSRVSAWICLCNAQVCRLIHSPLASTQPWMHSLCFAWDHGWFHAKDRSNEAEEALRLYIKLYSIATLEPDLAIMPWLAAMLDVWGRTLSFSPYGFQRCSSAWVLKAHICWELRMYMTHIKQHAQGLRF